MTAAQPNEEPRIDTRDLARALHVKHHSLLALVKKYQQQLLGFGPLPAVLEPTGAMGRPVRFMLLNEEHAFFILLLVRPTKHSIEVKSKFIEGFAAMRSGGDPDPDFWRLAGPN